MPRHRWNGGRFALLAALTGMVGILCSGVQSASAAASGVKAGGSMTVFEVGVAQGAWPTGIDPPNDTSPGINQDLMSAVYGELLELGPGGKVVPDLATGYKILDNGLTYEFDIRRGVKFSDGTPFDAAAVAFNFKRDFADKTSHNPFWPLKSITTSGQYKVDVNLTAPYSPLINSMFDSPQNWIVSPTSLQKLGETKFSLYPVGAGPFKVVSDIQNVTMSLEKNPLYWQKGRPYLDKLTFKSVQSDNTALEDMEAGQGQAYIDMTTLQLVPAFKKAGFKVTLQPSTTPNDIQINTTKPPFNNILAREALYYATDVATLDKTLNGDTTKPVQGFTTPTGLFYNATVPGYRTYNLAKAKAIVKQLGGLSFTLMISSAPGGKLLGEALQTMYTDAGMKVTLNPLELAPIIAAYASGNWQATTQNSGSWDPAVGVGQNVRFLSGARFSGVDDKHLDQLLTQATRVPEEERAAIYQKAAIYESQKAYAVEMYPASLWDIAAKNVTAPGLTSLHPQVIGAPEVWWADAGFTS
ncbi:MAG: ABC transporter substrate-binding protein [Acidimicrobiaceae bacterium]|nr:ABC transporter substrate-binding protein [Acidimicrobiaceae bacterium]